MVFIQCGNKQNKKTSSSMHTEVCKHLDCSAVEFNFGLKGGMTEPGNFLI